MQGRLALVGVLLLLAAALSACGGERAPEASDEEVRAALGAERDLVPVKSLADDLVEVAAPVKTCGAGDARRVGSRKAAYAAVLRRPARVFSAPGGKPVSTFDTINVNGVPTVFSVRGVTVDERCDPVWYRVQVPLRPNGHVAYVRAEAVELFRITTRIEVDLSDRRIEVFDKGRLILETRAAVGTGSTPTPTGFYYVNQRLVPADPSGPW